RMVGFVAFLGMSIFCFMIAFFTIPMLALNPAKFATTYTLGSILALVSMSLLQGPRAFLRHIFSRERLPFTLMYLASMIVTLYFAVVKHAYIMTVVFSLIQIICLLYYFGSYIPGGTSGLGFITKYFARNTVGLPV
ncbi:vesicle transport protein, partial [Gaertneriomyces semiglobifer]